MSAAYTVVCTLASILEPVSGAGTATAIVVFTAAVRLLLSPLSYAQARGDRRRAALAPRIRQLQERHRDDPGRLAAELSTLYRAGGTTPYGGCLLALLQLPFFLTMYRLFTVQQVGHGPNRLLAERLFGVPLGTHLGDVLTGGAQGAPVLVFGLLFAALAALAWLSARRLRRNAAETETATAETGVPVAGAVAGLLRLLPYGTLLAAAVVPLAAGLYLVTTTAWTALEYAVLRRPTGRPTGCSLT